MPCFCVSVAQYIVSGKRFVTTLVCVCVCVCGHCHPVFFVAMADFNEEYARTWYGRDGAHDTRAFL
jgi:hypothetical protein